MLQHDTTISYPSENDIINADVCLKQEYEILVLDIP